MWIHFNRGQHNSKPFDVWYAFLAVYGKLCPGTFIYWIFRRLQFALAVTYIEYSAVYRQSWPLQLLSIATFTVNPGSSICFLFRRFSMSWQLHILSIPPFTLNPDSCSNLFFRRLQLTLAVTFIQYSVLYK